MKTALDTPEEEPVDYETLVSRYIDQHKQLKQDVYTVMTRALRLGGRK